MNPISEFEWKLNEHKNQLSEIETYRRRLGYEGEFRNDSEAKHAAATRTLIALSTKTRQFFDAVFGGSGARSVRNPRPETSVNQ
jgi:hypothetical protein